MAFVNERMTKEQREAFKERKIPAPTWPLRILESSTWTVDHERDIFLVWGSRLREDNHSNTYFVLGWEGIYIQIKLKFTFLNKTSQRWSIVEFDIPKELIENKQEIITDLKKALTVFGLFGNPLDPNNNNINVIFDF